MRVDVVLLEHLGIESEVVNVVDPLLMTQGIKTLLPHVFVKPVDVFEFDN